MNKNTENIAKIEIKGFYDLCNRLKDLEEENKQLKANNKIMADELTYFKEHCADLEEDVNHIKTRCRKLSVENHDLKLQVQDMKFTRKYLTSKEAGKAFACEVLGHTMSDEEIAIEAAEDSYVPYNGDDF